MVRARLDSTCYFLFRRATDLGPGKRMGMVAVKVEPTPGSLRTLTRPPRSRASLLASGSPRPAPLARLWSGLSTWPNSSKTRSMCSGSIPIPGSETEKTTRSPEVASALTRTSPRSVNLRALERKFWRIWVSFAWSVQMRQADGDLEDQAHRRIR